MQKNKMDTVKSILFYVVSKEIKITNIKKTIFNFGENTLKK